MERSIYVNETTFEEMRRLKEQHDLPVIMVWSYLNNGKMRVILMYDERDYWMTAKEALEYGMVDEILSKKSK